MCSIDHQLITGMLERLRNWALCSTVAPFPSFRPCYARVFVGLSCYFPMLKSLMIRFVQSLIRFLKSRQEGAIRCVFDNHWHSSKFRMFYLGVPMIYIAIFRTRQVHAATSLGVINYWTIIKGHKKHCKLTAFSLSVKSKISSGLKSNKSLQGISEDERRHRKASNALSTKITFIGWLLEVNINSWIMNWVLSGDNLLGTNLEFFSRHWATW